jgi:hypothetical protein
LSSFSEEPDEEHRAAERRSVGRRTTDEIVAKTLVPHLPTKAYRDINFLTGTKARTLRILAEYLEPEARFEREDVDSTIVFFGFARRGSGRPRRGEKSWGGHLLKRSLPLRTPGDLPITTKMLALWRNYSPSGDDNCVTTMAMGSFWPQREGLE